MNEHLITLDKETYLSIRDFTTEPGGTILYRGSGFGSGQLMTAQTTRKRPDTFHFRSDEFIQTPCGAFILESDGHVYSVAVLSASHTLQRTGDYYGEIDGVQTHTGEELAEVQRIFREHGSKQPPK